MPTFLFPERDTLRLVLASGGVAANVSQTSAEAGWDEQGRLWLTTNAVLPSETAATLQQLGVRIVGTSAAKSVEKVACWQQLFPLKRSAIAGDDLGAPILFDLPGIQFSSLVSEIERCRGGSYTFHWLDDAAIDKGSDRVFLLAESP